MARKVNYLQQVLIEGVPVEENNEVISYLADTSRDNLAFHQQYFIIEANTTYKDINLSLRGDAAFTYFFEQSGDVLSEVTVKVNNDDTEFNISPDFWIEEPLTGVEAQNLDTQDRLIYVVQLYTQGISYNADC